MRLYKIAATLFLCFPLSLFAQTSLIIQEETLGVCTMDGIVENSAEGYTGSGYANIDNGLGIGMSWSFNLESTGEYKLVWRYALGGSDETSRDAKLLLNNVPTDTVLFPHSGSSSWAEWISTDTLLLNLESGYNKVNLLSITEKGLPNIDYFEILGSNITAVECVPSYTFQIGMNSESAGVVDFSPKQDIYDAGTEIHLTAHASPGYFFHSWSGEAASVEADHTFTIESNTSMTALFYPEGAVSDPDVVGYATVQHDNGTPYLLTGGSLGETVQAGTLAELKAYLGANVPYVVELATTITGENSDEISIRSDKTLIGITSDARIEGIPVKIDGARNIIIKNIAFAKVIRFDELEINAAAMNIWIDHCDFYTDRDHGVDYYDGLLDIKNQSRFITVSWSRFHDHEKCILISSGDQEVADSIIRVTFHHNYMYDCGSRLPSIRFGKSHLFNNYYRNSSTAINTRMGACVKVENNYFDHAGTAVGMLYSPEPGSVDLSGNIFINSGYSEEPACELVVPYEYESVLLPADQVPDAVIAGTGGPSPENITDLQEHQLIVYPSPTNGILTVSLSGLSDEIERIILVSMSGQEFNLDPKNISPTGDHIFSLDLSHYTAGIYILKLVYSDRELSKRILLQ